MLETITQIEDDDARLIALTLYGLVLGQPAPKFDSEEWHHLSAAVHKVGAGPAGKPHFEIGIAAIGIVLQTMIGSAMLAQALYNEGRAP